MAQASAIVQAQNGLENLKGFACNYAHCPLVYDSTKDLLLHLKHYHFTRITRVKKSEWDEFLKSEQEFARQRNALLKNSAQVRVTTSARSLSSADEQHPIDYSPLSPPGPSTPSPRIRRQSFHDYNAQSSPTPPSSPIDPSPQLSTLVSEAVSGRRLRPLPVPEDSPISSDRDRSSRFLRPTHDDHVETSPISSFPEPAQRRFIPTISESRESSVSAHDVETQLMKSPAASAKSLSPPANDARRPDDVLGSPREEEEVSQEPSAPIPPSPPKLRRSSRARSQTPAPFPDPPTMAGRKRSRQGSVKPESIRNQEQVREQAVESSKPPSKRRNFPSQPSRSASGVSEASVGSKRGARRRRNKAVLDPVADRIPEEDESPTDPQTATDTANEGTARVVGLTVGSLVVTPSPSKHPSTQPEDKSGAGSDSQTVSEPGTQNQPQPRTQSQSQTQPWATQAPSRFANGYNFSQVPLQTQAPYQSQDEDL